LGLHLRPTLRLAARLTLGLAARLTLRVRLLRLRRLRRLTLALALILTLRVVRLALLLGRARVGRLLIRLRPRDGRESENEDRCGCAEQISWFHDGSSRADPRASTHLGAPRQIARRA
jgi:hypothetical protein